MTSEAVVEVRFRITPPQAIDGFSGASSFGEFSINFNGSEAVLMTENKNDSGEEIAGRAKKVLDQILWIYGLKTQQYLASAQDGIVDRRRWPMACSKNITISSCLVLPAKEEIFKEAMQITEEIKEDELLRRALYYYNTALKDRNMALFYLHKAIECIEETGLVEKCEVSKKERDKVTAIMNRKEIATSRHAGKEEPRNISKEEREKCFDTTNSIGL